MGILGLMATALQGTRDGWRLPPDASVEGYGSEVDNLFMLILYLTGALFVLTELLLAGFVAVYLRREGKRAKFQHGNRKLELFWTIGTAVILVWLALYQKDAWDKIKVNMPKPTDPGDPPWRVQLVAKQFTWYFIYPGADGKFNTGDELVLEKLLVVPADRKVMIEGRSLDVIHSLFIPYMRVKQDIVPGMTIKIWFEVGDREPGKPWTTEEMRAFLGEERVEGVASAPSDGKTVTVASFVGKKNLADRTLFWKSGEADAMATIRSFDASTGTLTLWDPFLPKPVAVGDSLSIPEFNYEIACAELCGGSHFKMAAKLQVTATTAEADAMVKQKGVQRIVDPSGIGERTWNWSWEVPAP